ncbi:hypothetical protein E1293_20600 [Actinomadura darangshiensis]|uniref:DUF4352 domain-containing protein n=1 Tax=Actinomadura darangshiensis TaxID=705336 RepID=A0A4R5B5F7_9ACTN|nr:hypothetical protein [Actinomadura darangshiensis]TDD80515.1 hypothetical protein E1293_20600 [Actinomadura darangshiensis]
MQSTAPVPPPPADQERRAPARRWVVPVSVAVAVAVLAPVLWVAGGFKETPKQPGKPAGKALDLGLFSVTVHDARAGLADGQFGAAKERYLIVRMRVLNKGKETVSLSDGGLKDGVVARTAAGKWVEPDRFEGVAGGTATSTTQPGLPVEASAMWKLGQSEVPAKLTVGLRMWKYDHGFTDTAFNWLPDKADDALAGRLALPVGR